jgi:CRISPR-associated protein (Cas_Cas02710)
VVVFLIAIVLVIIYGTNWAQKFKNTLAKLGIIGTQVPARATLAELKETCAGLVVIMSLQPQNSPAEVAIRYHWNNGRPSHLQHCWVICTDTSVEYARAMKQRFMEEGIDENQLHLYYGSYKLNEPDNPSQSLTLDDCDADDPDQVLRLVNSIYADAETKGLSESEVIVDFTGGTKPLSIGAFLACASPERRLEYLTQTRPPKIVEVRISYKLEQVKP